MKNAQLLKDNKCKMIKYPSFKDKLIHNAITVKVVINHL